MIVHRSLKTCQPSLPLCLKADFSNLSVLVKDTKQTKKFDSIVKLLILLLAIIDILWTSCCSPITCIKTGV